MKIYTKSGDKGTTGLLGGTRVPKHHYRIDTYGTVDELNSWIGLLRDQEIDPAYSTLLLEIQENLFTVGSFLATDPEKRESKRGVKSMEIVEISESDVTRLEEAIDAMNTELPPMTHFVLPGGHQTVSICHITRTVCRRAERLISALHETEPLNPVILTYINRLSDYLFVLARKLTSDLQAEEIKWIPRKKS